MKAEDFFNEQEFITSSKLPKERRNYTYFDLIAFAKSYHENEVKNLNLASINNWLPLPSASESWEDYNRAANNNCYLKLDNGSECRYNDMDWNFAKVTHYRHVE